MNTFKSILVIGLAASATSSAVAQDFVSFASLASGLPGTNDGSIILNWDKENESMAFSGNSPVNASILAFDGVFGNYFDVYDFVDGTDGTATFNTFNYGSAFTNVEQLVWSAANTVSGTGDVEFTMFNILLVDDGITEPNVLVINGLGKITDGSTASVAVNATIAYTFNEDGTASWSATTVVVPEPSSYAGLFGCFSLVAVCLLRRNHNI